MLSTCIQCGICSSSCSMRYNMNLRKAIARFLSKQDFWSNDLWNCTTCLICQQRCPRGIKLVDAIITSRSEVIEKGSIPKELRDMLENIRKFHNPFGALKRPNFDAKIVENGNFDYLLFIGCSAYDQRVQKVVEKAIELLKALKVNFAILPEEKCCGNDVRALGEFGLFEHLLEDNMKIFWNFGVKKIITISPHCYNAFKNYYGLQTYHITEILLKKVLNAELRFSKRFDGIVTYHDPCYLSRYNNLILEPRELLKSVPGLEFVEMQRSKELSLCCGGGSGGIVRDFVWKPSTQRIMEAVLTGANFMAVSCPFCLVMLEDSVKTKKVDIKVLDVIEILYDTVF
ncbi:MAG: (Fe-S)-binding protein [Archaeoglobaceae archaeon]|nr:(Fe-S)-binding protein [Archaeoglobaceae archaeon]